MIAISKFIDLTGKNFNKLFVIRRVENAKNGDSQWLCKCDCGNEATIRGWRLASGETKSCGCLGIEAAKTTGKANKKYNTYNLSNEYGIGYTLKDEEFYFDLEDYDKIKDYCWSIGTNGYPATNGHKKTTLHRLIMDCPSNMVIDHINHNKLDNRKQNLRICTQHKNSMNCETSKNNTSGVTGVSWNKQRNKWYAYITINYKQKGLGLFDNFEDAVKARKEAEEKYFGEFSYYNSVNY